MNLQLVLLVFVASLGLTLAQEIADPETTTPHGCTCNSLCGASVFDGFKRDWCTVNGECGESSITAGNWDYCLYKDSARPDYVAMDWTPIPFETIKNTCSTK